MLSGFDLVKKLTGEYLSMHRDTVQLTLFVTHAINKMPSKACCLSLVKPMLICQNE
jgi:hypothetical protein